MLRHVKKKEPSSPEHGSDSAKDGSRRLEATYGAPWWKSNTLRAQCFFRPDLFRSCLDLARLDVFFFLIVFRLWLWSGTFFTSETSIFFPPPLFCISYRPVYCVYASRCLLLFFFSAVRGTSTKLYE